MPPLVSPTRSSLAPLSTFVLVSYSTLSLLFLPFHLLSPPLPPFPCIGLQIQSNTNRIYQGPWDAIKKIYSSHGLRGLYKAQGVTALREVQGYGIYFAAYESLIQRECSRSGRAREDIGTLEVCAYGAVAGYAMWTSMYPIDLVKSRLQTDGWTLGKDRRFSSALDCIRKIWAEAGFRGFWKGLTPCLLRAAPANAVTFVGFEWAARQLN